MIRTISTKIPIFSWAFCSFFCLAIATSLQAQQMVCNDLVQVSVDNTPNICQAGLNADQILEGNPIPGHDYLIEITYNWVPVVSGINQVTITNSSQYFSTNLTVKITDQTGGGNSCWGQIHLQDKLPPALICPNVSVLCSDDLNLIAPPTAIDNCDPSPTISLTGEQTNTTGLCANGFVTITRHYIAVDASGNTSAPCNRVITVNRPTVVDFPNDITWNCEQYDAFPSIILATPKHPYVGDSKPATNLVIDVNLNPLCDDDDDPSFDGAAINSTNNQNGGTGCPGNGLDDEDVLALTGSGVVANIIGQHCNYQQSKSDQVLTICGSSFKIVRTWTVLNWCTGLVVTVGVGGEDNVQVIKVVDDKAPVVVRPPFTVSANIQGQHPQPCRSIGFLPPPTVTDNCSNWTIKILTTIGEAVYLGGNPANGGMIPNPGLALGNHTVTYQVTDECGNVTNLAVPIQVIDDIAPATICVEYTEVSLTNGGPTTVLANAFNSASYDNCCLDHFEVRRMVDPCNDNHNDLLFGPSVVFCCDDAANSPVMVVMKAVDCYGNSNECMVEVFVNDKLNPTLVSCPPNQRITCNWYVNNLETQLAGQGQQQQCDILTGAGFGNATYYDNCSVTVTCNTSINLDQCLEGTIVRTFTAKDPSNNTTAQTCSQTISVDHVSDWAIEFPADISVNCGTTPPDFGEPEIFYENCELVAVSYDDDLFNVVQDACYKIVRNWTVINWCVVGANVDQEVVEQPENQLGLPFPQCDVDSDGDCDARTFRDSWRSGSSNPNRPTLLDATRVLGPDTDNDTDPWDGYIVYQQVIKVNDAVDPVFANNCTIPDVCIDGNACSLSLVIPQPDVDDCSPNITVTAEINFGGVWVTGFGPYANVGPGTYVVRYVAQDNCNNQTQCTTTLTVRDCKKPTPYCKNGLVIELMQTGMVDVWASDFNAGSFDNCPGTLKLSFSPDVNDIGNTYTCDDLGQQPVQIWVTDAAGNQDFCETFIEIQDNMGACGNGNLIAGVIATEEDLGVENVSVNVNSPNGFTQNDLTNSAGGFGVNIAAGGDYTVTPLYDENPMNGVSTFDLVLMSKHILGVTPLGSPYKIIAADANKSNTVTTFDLVETRKVILQINNGFPNNTSWRFIPSSHVFPNANNPFEAPFPEVINLNDVTAVLENHFVAIKVGDVNGSAAVNLLGSNEDRSVGNFVMNTDDRNLIEGEEFAVDFMAKDLTIQGFQFTLNFEVDGLEMLQVEPGVANEENFGFALLEKGALTASWNGVANESKLFSVVFRAKKGGKLSDLLDVNSRFTTAEAYSQNGDLLNVQLAFNAKVNSSFALYQNTPNPFKGTTVVGFNLPEQGVAELTLTDISGKVLKTIEREFNSGYNEIHLSSNELPVSGVVYYSLKTAGETATKKMVIVE